MLGKFLNWIKTSNSLFAKFCFKTLLFIYEKIIGGLFIHSIYDNFRYFRYSAGIRLNTKEKYDSTLIKEYHKIEKGLTYQNFRPYFGKKVIDHIFDIIEKGRGTFGLTPGAKIALNTIGVYLTFHRENDFLEDLFIENTQDKLTHITQKYSYSIDLSTGGTLDIDKLSVKKSLPKNPEDFFNSRYSIRDFSSEPVEINDIEKAVKIAQKTPSVCNRQSSRVYVLSEKKDILSALKFQNGNTGFNTKIDKLLIITTDLSSFHIGIERYQNWIDGGMFSMSIVYALHSLGIGSCCLNWSAYFYNDIRLRKVVPIKKNESIIMMIAVGNIPKKIKVAQSPRKNINEVLFKV